MTPTITRPLMDGDRGNILPSRAGATYKAVVPAAARTTTIPTLIRMPRPAPRSWAPVSPRNDNADQKVSTPRRIASMTLRRTFGERRRSHRQRGAELRPVRGARTEVTAVVIVRIGDRGETPSASAGLNRPMARENSPICGIVIPTLAASVGLLPARREPTVLAAILPAMNTAVTIREGRIKFGRVR